MPSGRMFRTLLMACAIAGKVYAYPTYQAAIPNGARPAYYSFSNAFHTGSVYPPLLRVPGNLVPGAQGVGHVDPNGGGARNQFGTPA
jgi:hypothetical protein